MKKLALHGKDEHILYMNDAIRKMADNKNVFVIDLYPAFVDKDKRMIISLLIGSSNC